MKNPNRRPCEPGISFNSDEGLEVPSGNHFYETIVDAFGIEKIDRAYKPSP